MNKYISYCIVVCLLCSCVAHKIQSRDNYSNNVRAHEVHLQIDSIGQLLDGHWLWEKAYYVTNWIDTISPTSLQDTHELYLSYYDKSFKCRTNDGQTIQGEFEFKLHDATIFARNYTMLISFSWTDNSGKHRANVHNFQVSDNSLILGAPPLTAGGYTYFWVRKK